MPKDILDELLGLGAEEEKETPDEGAVTPEEEGEEGSPEEGSPEGGGEEGDEEEEKEVADEEVDDLDGLKDLKPKLEKDEEEKKEEEKQEPKEAPKPEDYRAALEKDFAISEEDATLMLTEPEKVIPVLAANIYERIMNDMGAALREVIPQMMASQTAASETEKAARSMFFEINKDLEGIPDLEKHVALIAPQVRQLYPQATDRQVMALVGRSIRSTLNMTEPAAQPAVIPEPVQKPHVPASPASSGLSGRADGKDTPEGENPFITELIESANL